MLVNARRPVLGELGREPRSAQRQGACFLFHITPSQLNGVPGDGESCPRGRLSQTIAHRARWPCITGHSVWDGGSLGGGEEGERRELEGGGVSRGGGGACRVGQ